MKEIRILLLDFGAPAEWSTTLGGIITTELGRSAVLRHECHSPAQASTARSVAESVIQFQPSLLLLLLPLEGQEGVEDLWTQLNKSPGAPPIVVVTEADESGLLHQLFKLGVSDFLVPPLRSAEVWPRLRRWLRFIEEQHSDVNELKRHIGLQQLVGESPVLLAQLRKIPQFAQCNAGLLITGETGTGKELCARAVHYLSLRAEQPFIALNCGALPADLVENELFGHEAGAYTNANSAHPGAIREANGGTLFLDEIDSLPVSAQVKLLRFLQEKEFRPLGARKPTQADIRIVAAANTQLENAIQAGRFRADLFYRLNVLRLDLPALRDRREDIPMLARHFVTRYTAEFSKPTREIIPAALHKLSLHHWPGNVRELENVIERAVALANGGAIQPSDIDVPVPDTDPVTSPTGSVSFRRLKAKVVADFERDFVADLLERYQGNIAQAARAAQKNRRAFFQLMRKHQIRVEHVSAPSDSQVVKVVIQVDKKVHPPLRAQA